MAMVGGLAAGWFIWRVLREPVRRLVQGTQAVATGDLSTRIMLRSGGELGALAEAFNRMTEDLSRARERTQRWEDELARAVHEKTEELSRAQAQMLHMEKMASLGKLSAIVAHELNNPLAGILVYAKLIQRELGSRQVTSDQADEIQRYLDVIGRESARCGDIVRNLLLFARQSRADFGQQHLNSIIERSMLTVQHLAKQSGIECVVEPIGGDDQLTADANQLQQALVALLVNAVEAMPAGGTLTVRAEGDAAALRVEIIDTGVGITPGVLPHIFEPFVSTKGDEKGVGLGLAVAYGIVRRHEGHIEVQSQVGAGTTFRVVLPRHLTSAEAASVEQKPLAGSEVDG
jgi:two-component system NtrC family sensor kinase